MISEAAKTIRVPARLENLEKLVDFIIGCLECSGVPQPAISDIHLAADEACTNTITYAYPAGERGDIELSCAVSGGTITVTIRDWGVPFNPLQAPSPDIGLDIEDRPIGGLGIFLMKKFSDRLEYRRVDGSNLLTIIKKAG
ncbi:MAG: ATP-binding protein [PVC group bacterium]